MRKILITAVSHLALMIKSEAGAFLIFFAVLVPILLGFGSIAIDGAQVLNTKVRLSEAADEAALAIAAINNKNATANNKTLNESIARNYISFYARNQGDLTNVNVDYDADKSTYYVTSIYDAKTILSMPSLTGVDKHMTVGNDRLGSGFVTKTNEILSADVTFVLDFSSSTTCDSTAGQCDKWSNTGSSNSRVDVLKTVVSSILNKYKNVSRIQFSIVPFDTGVPFRPDQAVNLKNLNTKNEAGGEQIGCSVPYTLLSPYKNVDYAFWANKYLNFEFANSVKYEDKYYNRTFYNMDGYRYFYYSKVIGPARGLTTNAQLVSAGLCVDNGIATSILYGKYRYSCETNSNQSIFTTENKNKVISQYNTVIDLMNLMYWTESSARKGEFSIANGGTIDFDATLANIFNTQNIIEFYQPTAPNVLSQRPFTGMCQSAQAGPNALLRDSDEFETSSQPLYDRAASLVRTSKSQTYLIPLTQNLADKNELVSAINQMKPGGGTDEMSGLLRAAPIAAKGDAMQKIIIVISDGDNNLTNNLPASLSGNKSVTEIFLKKGVCQVIRNQLDTITTSQYNGLPKPSEIHYISLNMDRTDDYNMWLTQCADNDPKFVHDAKNIGNLVDLIDTIIVTSETGFFKNKD